MHCTAERGCAITRVAVNGVFLNVEVAEGVPVAAADGPAAGTPAHPLVLLHGFTGSAKTWQPHLKAFARRGRVMAVDLLGHGQSDAPADPARYSMAWAVNDLIALLDGEGFESVDLLGYSMGGRLALHLALSAPGRIRALIVESASPGIADPAERAARRARDDHLAAFIEREGVEAFVTRWEAQPLFESQRRLPDQVRAGLRDQRLHNRPHGLANSLRGMGAGAQEPLWGRLPQLKTPTLLVAGELDPKYCRIAEAMGSRMPQARVAIVPGAGHAVHLEQPRVFDQLVLAFLEDLDSKTPGTRGLMMGHAGKLETREAIHRHPLRNGRGDGQDHDQPARGA